MKLKLFVFLLSFGIIFFIGNCSKDPIPTSLQISLVDSLGNPVPGATVGLYSTYPNFSYFINSVSMLSEVSDATGNVTFKNLSGNMYFWFASKNCISNGYPINDSHNYESAPLKAHSVNTAKSVLKSTGTILVINNSTNGYVVRGGGAYPFNVSASGGPTSWLVTNYPIGQYTITATQTSGYVGNPIVRNFNGILSCGDTLKFIFPN